MDITIPVLILAIPLFMFIFLGLLGMKMTHKLAGILGCLGMGTVLVLSYYTLIHSLENFVICFFYFAPFKFHIKACSGLIA